MSWDLTKSGFTGGSAQVVFQSPDGRFYFDYSNIYDRSGHAVAKYPWSRGTAGTWTRRGQLCAADGSPQATGSPLVLQIASPAQPARTITTGFGTYGDNATTPVLGCDEGGDVAVVAMRGQGIALGTSWVIQLSTGKVIRTTNYNVPSGESTTVRISADGSLLAESRSAFPSQGTAITTIRRTLDGALVGVVNDFAAGGFSGDASLLVGMRSGRAIVIDRVSGKEVWVGPEGPWGGMAAEPGGKRAAVGLGFGGSDRSDVYIVSPDGSAVLLPAGAIASLVS